MDVKELDILGDSIGEHWYHASKTAATLTFLDDAAPREILDVGADSAFFSKYLLAHTTAGKAWCVDPRYPEDSDAVTEDSGKPISFRRAPAACTADLLLLWTFSNTWTTCRSVVRICVPRACPELFFDKRARIPVFVERA